MESPQGGRAREFTSSNDMAFGPAESFNMQLLMAGMLRSTCPGNDELWNALCVNSRYCQHSFTPPFIQERVMATRSGENQLMPSCILQRSRSPNSSFWVVFICFLAVRVLARSHLVSASASFLHTCGKNPAQREANSFAVKAVDTYYDSSLPNKGPELCKYLRLRYRVKHFC